MFSQAAAYLLCADTVSSPVGDVGPLCVCIRLAAELHVVDVRMEWVLIHACHTPGLHSSSNKHKQQKQTDAESDHQ